MHAIEVQSAVDNVSASSLDDGFAVLLILVEVGDQSATYLAILVVCAADDAQ